MAQSSTFNGFQRVRGSTTSALKIVSGNGAGVDAQDRCYFGSAQLVQEGANPAALLMGYGNSTTRVQSASASGKFISFYTEDTGGGGQYGVYFRHYISSAGLSDDCFRAFGTVNNVAAGTARGAHISLSFGTSGTITGLGCALEATLHIPSTAGQTGTLYAVKAAINSDAATSDPAGVTTLAYFAAVNQGDAAGGADVDEDAALLHIDGHEIAAGNLISAVTTGYALAELTHSIRINVGGTLYYIPISNVAASDT